MIPKNWDIVLIRGQIIHNILSSRNHPASFQSNQNQQHLRRDQKANFTHAYGKIIIHVTSTFEVANNMLSCCLVQGFGSVIIPTVHTSFSSSHFPSIPLARKDRGVREKGNKKADASLILDLVGGTVGKPVETKLAVAPPYFFYYFVKSECNKGFLIILWFHSSIF